MILIFNEFHALGLIFFSVSAISLFGFSCFFKESKQERPVRIQWRDMDSSPHNRAITVRANIYTVQLLQCLGSIEPPPSSLVHRWQCDGYVHPALGTSIWPVNSPVNRCCGRWSLLAAGSLVWSPRRRVSPPTHRDRALEAGTDSSAAWACLQGRSPCLMLRIKQLDLTVSLHFDQKHFRGAVAGPH